VLKSFDIDLYTALVHCVSHILGEN